MMSESNRIKAYRKKMKSDSLTNQKNITYHSSYIRQHRALTHCYLNQKHSSNENGLRNRQMYNKKQYTTLEDAHRAGHCLNTPDPMKSYGLREDIIIQAPESMRHWNQFTLNQKLDFIEDKIKKEGQDALDYYTLLVDGRNKSKAILNKPRHAVPKSVGRRKRRNDTRY